MRLPFLEARSLALGLAIVTGLCLSGPAIAVMPDEMLRDPALEARAHLLSQTLRCVVCQNQSIDSSAAPLARDMRILLRQRILSGDSDQEAVNYIVQRYGNFVLLKPPFQLDTILLWVTPFAALLVAGGAFLYPLRRRNSQHIDDALAPSELEKIQALLDQSPSL